MGKLSEQLNNEELKREELSESEAGFEEERATDLNEGARLARKDDIQSEIEKAREEAERYKRRGQRLVDGNRFNFELFAESAAPRFVFSGGFAIDFKKKEVHMQTEWFSDRAFSDEQLLWATYHELAHFYDFAGDHRAILKKFEEMQESARKTGAALAERYKELSGGALSEKAAGWLEQKPIDPQHPEKGTMNKFEEIGYGIHYNFWNCLDDIYVNSLVAKRKPVYGGSGRHGEEVEKLYREQLFREADFSNLPRHKQIAYALLRRTMVSGEETVVIEEVEEVLNRKHQVLGKECTAEELIREFIKARNTLGASASLRYGILEKTLAPAFEELLSKDIADWKLPEQPEPQKGSAGEESGQESEGQGKSESGAQASEENEKGGQEGEGGQSESEGQGANEKGTEEEGGQQGSGQSESEQEDGSESGQAGGPGAKKAEGDEQKEKPARQSFAENIDDAFNPKKGGKPGQPGGDGPVIPFPVQSPEDINEIAEQFEKWKKEWEGAQREKKEVGKEEPAEAREKRLKESRDKAWCERYDVDYETFHRYEEVERAIKPYLAALNNLWRKIIYGHTKEAVVRSAGHYKEGEELDVDEAVREFSKILFCRTG